MLARLENFRCAIFSETIRKDRYQQISAVEKHNVYFKGARPTIALVPFCYWYKNFTTRQCLHCSATFISAVIKINDKTKWRELRK